MSADLDSLETTDLLYGERGDVPLFLPLMQGDVFRDVEVPVLGNEPRTVQVVMHPCSMRNGAELNHVITVAPVEPRRVRVDNRFWRSSSRFMPLPELLQPDEDHAARLPDLTAVPADSLPRTDRIATLSQDGIVLLQQRMVFSMTRFRVERPEIAAQLMPIFAELEMQAGWVERAVQVRGEESMAVVIGAERDFQAWLDADNRVRRDRLQDLTHHASLRRDAANESRNRYTA
jgi:hypothetical protein